MENDPERRWLMEDISPEIFENVAMTAMQECVKVMREFSELMPICRITLSNGLVVVCGIEDGTCITEPSSNSPRS